MLVTLRCSHVKISNIFNLKDRYFLTRPITLVMMVVMKGSTLEDHFPSWSIAIQTLLGSTYHDNFDYSKGSQTMIPKSLKYVLHKAGYQGNQGFRKKTLKWKPSMMHNGRWFIWRSKSWIYLASSAQIWSCQLRIN